MEEQTAPVIFDRDFFASLNRLRMLIKLKPSSGLSGSRKSGAKGSSLEFSDFREYILGDDLRRIDWNAYGRMDKLLVKLFVEEKEGMFRIFTDCSTSMDYGKASRGICASRLAAALTYILLGQLDRVSLITGSPKGTLHSKAMTGRQSFARFLTQLEHVRYSKDYDLWNVIKSEIFHSRGVVILLSDFYTDTDMEAVLKYLTYRKQKVILIHILADEELHPDMEGTLALIDSENDARVKVTMSGDLLKQYDRTLREFLNRCEHAAKKYGAAYVLAASSKPLEETLIKLLAQPELLYD